MNDLIRKKDVANWMFENRMCTSLNNAYDKLKELPMVDLAEHDKQIRDEVIDEVISRLLSNYEELDNVMVLDIIEGILEQMKG